MAKNGIHYMLMKDQYTGNKRLYKVTYQNGKIVSKILDKSEIKRKYNWEYEETSDEDGFYESYRVTIKTPNDDITISAKLTAEGDDSVSLGGKKNQDIIVIKEDNKYKIEHAFYKQYEHLNTVYSNQEFTSTDDLFSYLNNLSKQNPDIFPQKAISVMKEGIKSDFKFYV